MAAENIDLLFDLLDNDEDLVESENEEENGTETGARNSNAEERDFSIVDSGDKSKRADDIASSQGNSNNSDDENETAEKEEEENIGEVSEMEKELKLMQKKMKEMQKMLEEKKKSQKSVENISNTTSKNSLSEVNIFDKDKTRNLKRMKEPSLPPKKLSGSSDQPHPRKTAKVHLNTPLYGPALPSTSTRIISGKEKEKLLKSLEEKDREKNDLITLVKNDLADSSDEENGGGKDKQVNPLMGEKYNSFGKEIKRISKVKEQNVSSPQGNKGPKLGFNEIKGATLNLTNAKKNELMGKNTMVERFSRLKVSNPRMDNQTIEAHMLGKSFIPIFKLKESALRNEVKGDWTTIGVMYYKSSQTSKNGNLYTMWKMTDLSGDIKTITVLLFGRSHNVHYKMPLNKVVGILNAKVLDSSKSELTLSVDHSDKILEIGDSIEAGKCQAKKQDGSGCTNLVNLSTCEYCSFHVKKAYKDMSSKRGELQSSFSGNVGVRSRIMNKVDPKGNFFVGGQSVNFHALNPCKLSDAHKAKEIQNLKRLGVNPVDKILKAEEKQRKGLEILHQNGKSLFRSHLNNKEKEVIKNVAHGVSAELGMKLLNPTPGARGLIKTLSRDSDITFEKDGNISITKKPKKDEDPNNPSSIESHNQETAKKLIFEHKKKLAEERAKKVMIERQMRESQPMLGRGFKSGGSIDLAISPKTDSKKQMALAKLKQSGKSGKIEKSNPNAIPGSKRKRKSEDEIQKSRKRIALALINESGNEAGELENSSENLETKPNRPSSVKTSCGEILSRERIEKIKTGKSRNENLVSDFEDSELEKNFEILEKKEQMEEKMLNTKEILTKAVTCKICNYTYFSQSELCKTKGHRIKVIEVKKRFFECSKCKNRTFALDKFPSSSCSKCGSANWVRCGMIKEKRGPQLESEQLMIRGAEQKHVNQTVKTALNELDM